VLKPSRPGLLADRDGVVPPPYDSPAAGASSGGALVFPSAQPAFPAVLPGAPLVTEEPGPILEPLEPETAPSAAVSEIILPEAPKIERLTHTVAKNESLWTIGQKYGITYQELAAYNHLDVNAVLPVGKVLNIPPGGRPGAAVEGRAPTVRGAAAPAPVSTAGTSTYVVQRGDSISLIAHRSGMTQAELRQLNGLKSDRINIGQKLLVRGEVKIPAGTTPKPAAPKPEVEKPAAPKPETTKPETTKPEETLPELTAPVAPEAAPAAPVAPEAAPTVPEVVPAPAPAAEAGQRRLPHDVCKDDTLENIAEMYGTTVQAIQQANPDLKSNADLKVGNTIMVPYK
jgi:LysM repeat protein